MEKLSTEKDEKNEIKLTDIALVAYLVCEGFKMSRIDRKRDKGTSLTKSDFYFEENNELEKATLNFFNHEAKVDPLMFSETLRNLRSYAKQG